MIDDKLKFPYLKKARSRNVQILVYHRVNDEGDPFFPGTPVKVFSKQMEYLVSHYNVLALEEAVDREIKRDMPDNAIAITFDDGYRDNYIHAFPILKQLDLPATIFLATDAIGSGRILWHDKVFSAFRETQVPFVRGFGRNASTIYPLKTLQEKLQAQSDFLRLIRSVSDAERSLLIDSLVTDLKVTNKNEEFGLMLTWDQVREMHRCGISFGSHTVTHPILSTLSNDKVEFEVCQSKRVIEEQIGFPVRTFAYPNGTKDDFNEAIKDLVRQAGYICGLTTIFGANGGDRDLFELRRATPWDEEIFKFGLRLSCYKLCA